MELIPLLPVDSKWQDLTENVHIQDGSMGWWPCVCPPTGSVAPLSSRRPLKVSPSSLERLRDDVCVSGDVTRRGGGGPYPISQLKGGSLKMSQKVVRASLIYPLHKALWSEANLRGEGQNQYTIRHMQNILQRLNSRMKDLVAMNKWFKDRAARQVMCQSEKEVVSIEPTRKWVCEASPDSAHQNSPWRRWDHGWSGKTNPIRRTGLQAILPGVWVGQLLLAPIPWVPSNYNYNVALTELARGKEELAHGVSLPLSINLPTVQTGNTILFWFIQSSPENLVDMTS